MEKINTNYITFPGFRLRLFLFNYKKKLLQIIRFTTRRYYGVIKPTGKKYPTQMEWFWIECCKTKTKVITKGQSEERRNTFQSQ